MEKDDCSLPAQQESWFKKNFLPVGSRRRILAKIAKKGFANPSLIWEAIKNGKFFEFFRLFSKGTTDLLDSKISQFQERFEGTPKDNAPEPMSISFLPTDKKTILVIDKCIPAYDRDGGSKTTFQYLHLLCDLDFHVVFMADDFLRYEPYASEIEDMGVEILWGNFYRTHWEAWLVQNSPRLNYVYLNRPDIAHRYIDFISETTEATILYYGMDLHYLREKRRYEVEKTEEALMASKYWEKIEIDLINKVDCLLTLSTVEREIISTHCAHKPIVLIPPFYTESPNSPVQDFSNRKDILFVGGFAHPPNSDGVRWFIEEIFPQVLETLPEMKFILVGSHLPEGLSQKNPDHIIVKGWLSDQELEELYSQVRIVVVPLRYGAGVKVKTLEAMRYGVPLVSTSIGIEGIPEIDKIIAPCNDGKEFAKKIVNLYEDKVKLSQLSRSYQNFFQNFFSKKAALAALNSALNP